MNLPEHSLQPAETRGGERAGGHGVFCSLLLRSVLDTHRFCHTSIYHLSLSPCLAHCLPSPSHPFCCWKSWRTWAQVPCLCHLTCSVVLSTVFCFSCPLCPLSVGFIGSPLLTHGSPGFFKAGLHVVKIQMRCPSGFLLVGWFGSKFRNLRHTCDGGIMVT